MEDYMDWEAHPDEDTRCEWYEVMAEEEMHWMHEALNEAKKRKKEEQENRIDFG